MTVVQTVYTYLGTVPGGEEVNVQSKYQPAIGLSLFESADNNEFINAYRTSLVHVEPLEGFPHQAQVWAR